MEKTILDKQNIIARKYTVMMNDEPIDLWIKGDQIKKAKFMDKKVDLNLDSKTVELIKDQPTKLVNARNMEQNEDFTRKVSDMLSSQLDLAITSKNDKILARFARSELVPDSQKDNFLEVINRPRGLRGLAVAAFNKTNSMMQNLAAKIDNFFEKQKQKIANPKLDKHLEKYQLKEFAKAPKIGDLDKEKTLDKELQKKAKVFVQENEIINIGDESIKDKALQNDFMKLALQDGYSITDAKIALVNEAKNQKMKSIYEDQKIEASEAKTELKSSKEQIDRLEQQLHRYKLKEASKNATLGDFKTLTKDMDQVAKIDILIENKEYQKMNEKDRQAIEDKLIFKPEPAKERAKEVAAIAKEIEKPAQVEQVFERNPQIDFSAKSTKQEIQNKWKQLQKEVANGKSGIEKETEYIRVNAIKFDGISKQKLDDWKHYATHKQGRDATVVDKFIDSTLKEAAVLKAAGLMKEVENGEYKFKDTFSKEALFKNADKNIGDIEVANQGFKKEVRNSHEELKERTAELASEKSFAKMLDQSKNLDPHEMRNFAEKLSTMANQLQEKANLKETTITKDDLKLAASAEKTQAAGQERSRS